MTTHKIAVVGGDGIGPEVIAEALKVIDAAGVSIERIDYDLGAARYLRDGTVLPDSVLDVTLQRLSVLKPEESPAENGSS